MRCPRTAFASYHHAMDHRALWAPWRLAYLQDFDDTRREAEAVSPGSTFLSAYWNTPQDDRENLVVHRTSHGMVLLNRYPYANGHLLVALGEGRPTLLDYDPDQRAAFWSLVEHAADLMQRALNPQGINFGINQGEAAGAGVPDHLHAHLVPRWQGDTNAMTVVGGTRVIPASLESMWEMYTTVTD
jgi:ATP adenylyltransferase